MPKQLRVAGSYFEDLEVGDEIISPGRTVTEADIGIFAGLTGDYNPLHTNAEFAAQTRFQQRISHGLLGLGIAVGLASRSGFIEGTAEAFMGLEWKFRAPIFIGDTIHVQAKVIQTKAMPRLGGGIVVFDVDLLNQRGETAQKGQWTLLMKNRPA
ncbi:MAG: dehydratase [Chloroflexi bacterium]|nr:dehydratase [Chloroflexota bacterium]